MVLVERVENLASEVQWRRAYQEINDFEHTLAEEGMIVIKLWMHMSHEEQLRRFIRRRDDPLKSWKLTDEDWRNREKRGEYDDAVSDMIRLTNGPLAPWDVISSENKRYGRVKVIETVIRRMEADPRTEGRHRWPVLRAVRTVEQLARRHLPAQRPGPLRDDGAPPREIGVGEAEEFLGPVLADVAAEAHDPLVQAESVPPHVV